MIRHHRLVDCELGSVDRRSNAGSPRICKDVLSLRLFPRLFSRLGSPSRETGRVLNSPRGMHWEHRCREGYVALNLMKLMVINIEKRNAPTVTFAIVCCTLCLIRPFSRPTPSLSLPFLANKGAAGFARDKSGIPLP